MQLLLILWPGPGCVALVHRLQMTQRGVYTSSKSLEVRLKLHVLTHFISISFNRYQVVLFICCCCNKLVQIGLKQHKHINSSFWRLGIQNRSLWATAKMSGGLYFSQGALEESSSLTFPVTTGCLHFLAHGLITLSSVGTDSDLPRPLIKTLMGPT